MQQPNLASALLSGRQLTPMETEAFLSLATEEWVSQDSYYSNQPGFFAKLATAVATNHGDRWLEDFISSPQSIQGNRFLADALTLNHSGEADHAWRAAVRAETAYLRIGNRAGALRSAFEQIYALRRGSRAQECLQKGGSVQQAIYRFSYFWIVAQTAMELSSCEIMADNPDQSRKFSRQALNTATRSHYGNLYLRALALQGNLDMLDGRSEATWRTDEIGLKEFWQAGYAGERAFQFYHDMQFDAEATGLNNLALLLQRETLAMIAGHGRYDFEALAHFRLAKAEGVLGNLKQARAELNEYQSYISRIPLTSNSRLLYQAYCEIGLAMLAIRNGSQSEAMEHLNKATPIVTQTDNAFLKIEYLQALTKVARLSFDHSKEEQYLRDILAVVSQQFQNTSSPSDRWHMRKTLDGARRELTEILLRKPHRPDQTFAEWNSWRSLETASINSIDLSSQSLAHTQLQQMGGSILLSFAILPHSVVTWIVTSQGVQEHVLPVSPDALQHEVLLAYKLCSDHNSNLEKVNAAGARLYELLLAPLRLTAEPGQEIRVQTDSFLSYVPWAALRTPEERYWGLAQRITIHTGSGLARPNESKSGLKRIVVATPNAGIIDGESFLPLPQAQDEANDISNLYSEARRLNTGQVTASRLKSELFSADALHFAGHALSRESGGELVIDAEQGISFLTASDLRQFKMPHVQLVVLSACATAEPGPDADQSPDGLVRAFIEAEVPTVIASRWDVDSGSTSQLMRNFYSLLKSGRLPGEALRDAQQHLIQNSKYQHPYYWSGFQKFN